MAGFLTIEIDCDNGVSINTNQGTIRIRLARIRAGSVRIAIDAPRECRVLRDEILDQYGGDWEKADAARRDGRG